jgi:hypothetical protein
MTAAMGSSAPPAGAASSAQAPDTADDGLRIHDGSEPLAEDPDFELSSTLDVPAFLRRQEG